MKAFLNWRYYVMFTLLAVGMVSVILIFSEDDRPLGAWLEVRLWLGIAASASLYIMDRLRIRWEQRGQIPEFTNQ